MAVKILTLGFVSAGTFESTMKHLYEGNFLEKPRDHYFLYQHYPLKKEETKQRQLRVCEKYNIHWYDAGYDRGLHKGMNYLFELVNPDDDDVIIGFDPDEWPISPGFDQALEDALTDPKYPDIVLAYLKNSTFPPMPYADVVGGRAAHIFSDSIAAVNVAAFKAGWFRAIGGWWQPTTHWGYLEVHVNSKIKETNKRRCILRDVRCLTRDLPPEFVPQSPIYGEYKGCQANWTSKESFEEWLNKRGLANLIND